MISTGCVRPGAETTGQLPKYPQNNSASRVADITTSFRGGMFSARRLAGTCRNSASKKSPSRDRSCISSRTTCETSLKSGSPCIFRSRIPAVMNVRRVSFVTFASKRTWCPTKLPYPPGPFRSHLSLETRSATLNAATLRGCVHTTRHPEPTPRSIQSSRRYCGTWVVLPDPVSPHTTAASCPTPSPRKASSKAVRSLNTGRFWRNRHMSFHCGSLLAFVANSSARSFETETSLDCLDSLS
mmetsp:Transcript_9817/g.32433  ORF Transcript_9817/g.32433 Transcript_9817/m.32433 type:complete len:241 (-) Transcript_9817:205-927(-)